MSEVAHLAPVLQAFDRIAAANPLRGTVVPANREREITGMFPMVRQHRRLPIEVRGMRRLDNLRDRGMQLLALFLQLRSERHFLRQRMLEEIFGERIER